MTDMAAAKTETDAQLMSQPGLQLVFGYVRNVDYPEQEPWSSELTQRVAMVMRAYRRDDVQYHFDTDLLLAQLQVILKIIDHDAAVFHIANQQLDSLEQLSAHYASQPVVCREPFDTAMLSRDGRPAAALMMYRCLGHDEKPPYRKSYVLTLNVKEVDQQQFAADCRQACAKCGCDWLEPLHHGARPKISLWQRVHDFITYDVEQDGA